MYSDLGPFADEDLTDLFWNDYKLLQKKQGFRFSVPSICLAHFASIQNHMHVLELGSGSGVISVLLYARNSTLHLTCAEIQASYADLTRRNFLLNNISAHTLHSDFRSLAPEHNNQYDLVITNPPYFPLGQGKVNPTDPKAIARHEICCTLEDVIAHSSRFLKRGGIFSMVHLPTRLEHCLSFCNKYHLYPKRLQTVHHHKNEAAQFILLEACKEIQQSLQILPPLIIYDGNDYTPAFQHLLGGPNP